MQQNNKMGHLDLIRQINRSSVLEIVKEKQPLSRAQIAKALGLSKTTVSSIVDELINKRFLFEYGEECLQNGIGRPSIMLGFNPKSSFYIGVDISTSTMHLIIADLAGDIVYEVREPSVRDADALQLFIKKSIVESRIEKEKLSGIGIGVPGVVTEEGKVLMAQAFGWKDYPLQKLMQDKFSLPVFVGNSVNMAALGERWLGSGERVDDMVYVRIGNGIRCSVISRGKLIAGHIGFAGEISFFMESDDIEIDEEKKCRIKSSLESRCSGNAMRRQGYEPERLFSAYRKQEPEAVAIVEQFVKDLSVALSNIVCLVNPSKIVIGGTVSDYMEQIIGEIRENICSWLWVDTDVCLGRLAARSGALGAINYAMTQEVHKK